MDADGDEKIGGLLAKLDAVAADVEGSTLKSPGKPPVVKFGFKILGRFLWKLFMLRLVLKTGAGRGTLGGSLGGVIFGFKFTSPFSDRAGEFSLLFDEDEELDSIPPVSHFSGVGVLEFSLDD